MAQNLFALSQSGASEANKPLVSFRAGKCTFANGTVTPVNKKGLVQVLQTPDSLLHFQWKDRTTGTVEDDLIIFPEEAQFVKATTTARVFLLKFTSGRKLFFWLQEPKDEKDKEYEEKINQYINNPPPPEQSAGGSIDGSTINNLRGLAAGMDQDQLRQMFQVVSQARSNSQVPPASTTTRLAPPAQPAQSTPQVPQTEPTPTQPAPPQSTQPAPTQSTSTQPAQTQFAPTLPAAAQSTPAHIPPPSQATPSQASAQAPISTSNGGQEKLSDDMAVSLSSILAGFGMPVAGQQGQEESLDLQDVLVPDLVFPLLSDDNATLLELFSHLPAGTQNLAGLRELLFSAQFGQTIDAFTHVVNSGHANALLCAFGFDPMLAGPVGVIDINGFITALQASVAKK